MVGFFFLVDFGCWQFLISLDCSYGKVLEEFRVEFVNVIDKVGFDVEGKVGFCDLYKF